MDKASGVYLTLTDKSFISGGTSAAKYVIPMRTMKGQLGLNRVTANTLEDVLGYDLSYNSNYYGLRQILETVSYVDVFRINQQAKLANAYFETVTGEKQSEVDADTFDDITSKSPAPVFAAGALTPGDAETLAVKLSPAEVNMTVINNNANVTESQVIDIEDCNKNEKKTVDNKEVLGGITVYNSTDDILVGVIIYNDTSTKYECHKVVDGEILDDVIGEVVFTDNAAEITLTAPFSKDSFWNIHTIPSTIENWVLTVGVYNASDETYKIKETYDFSVNSESPDYWGKLSFGDVQISIKDPSGTLSNPDSELREWFTLDSGSNGLNEIIPADVDVSLLDTCDANIMLMNGLTDNKLVNRFANKCITKKIHLFADAPAYTSYIDTEMWAKNVVRSEYVVIGARPDQQEMDDGSIFYVYPSVCYAQIFANMYDNYGNLNYPPAGPTYGTTASTNLLNTDYDMYMDELKTNRINHQITNNLGTMMWEQRTTYSLNSDLSYIAPVFILDTLSQELVNFERNFNFRYMTADDLLNQQSGLNTILKNYQDAGFLYDYTLKVPSFAEAQAAGRTLNIHVSVSVMKDSEVINIDLVLTNS